MSDSATSPSPQVPSALLAAYALTKLFPGLKALDNVDFSVQKGEVHALMGENGAGKSTLIKVLTGALHPDAGEILLDQRPVHPQSPADAVRLGISTVYQELNLATNLSVAENICLGREPRNKFGIHWREVYARAERALGTIGVGIDVRKPLGSCSTAHQQLTAIARALDVDAKVLILDEPTSSLDRHEVEQLFTIIHRLKSQGLGIVFITHFIDQVYEISDRITVLRNGAKVTETPTANLSKLELVRAMIGRDPKELEPKPKTTRTEVARKETILSAESVGRKKSVEKVSLQLDAGQIVGFAGLLGSGRTETVRLLYGLDLPDSGRLTANGKPLTKLSVRTAIANGLGLCPEDRKAQGILPLLTISQNIAIALQAKRGWFCPVTKTKKREMVGHLIRQLRIATPNADKPIDQLSGGNQQKVILARWLAAEPRLLLLDEPTRGIDVGAKFEIMNEIERLRDAGMAFVFVSSEIAEVVRMSDVVAIFRDRKMTDDFTGEDITEDRIMNSLAGNAP